MSVSKQKTGEYNHRLLKVELITFHNWKLWQEKSDALTTCLWHFNCQPTLTTIIIRVVSKVATEHESQKCSLFQHTHSFSSIFNCKKSSKPNMKCESNLPTALMRCKVCLLKQRLDLHWRWRLLERKLLFFNVFIWLYRGGFAYLWNAILCCH